MLIQLLYQVLCLHSYRDIYTSNITRVNNWDEINEIIKSYNKAINDGNVIVKKFKGTNEEGENEWVK